MNDLLEPRDGAYLFATSGGGLVQFDPAGTNSDGSHFTVVNLGQSELLRVVSTLIEDETGTIWCGTFGGVYRLTRAANGRQSSLYRPASRQEDFLPVVNTLAFDRQGALWIGTDSSGLYRCLSDGDVEHYTTQNGLTQNGISKLWLDRDGRVWATTQYNLGGDRILSNAGASNLFAGTGAGASNTTGNSNSFVGSRTGASNITGSLNSFFGNSAGQANTAGNGNSFLRLACRLFQHDRQQQRLLRH